jgi:hypothetical protein
MERRLAYRNIRGSRVALGDLGDSSSVSGWLHCVFLREYLPN